MNSALVIKQNTEQFNLIWSSTSKKMRTEVEGKIYNRWKDILPIFQPEGTVQVIKKW